MKDLMRFLKEEDGPTTVEYALMLSLIVLAAVVAVSTVGTSIVGVVKNIIVTLGF